MKQLSILIAGQVDHGKSTLIGRLLHECGQMPAQAKEKLDHITKQYGQDAIEWAFALDSLELERQQGITLDSSRIWLKRPTRELVLIDVPGHHELLANMLTGASDARAALLLIDAKEGITEQTKLHMKLLQLLGIRHIIITITKMDRVGYDQHIYETITKQARTLCDAGATLYAVPISARDGENMVQKSLLMPWYSGENLLALLDALPQEEDTRPSAPLRFNIQQVVKHADQRVLTGYVSSGALNKGQLLLACPSGSIANVGACISWPDTQKETATAGECVGITLSQPIFSQRGEVLCDPDYPPYFMHRCKAQLIWLGHSPMQTSLPYTLRIGTQTHSVLLSAAAPLARHTLGEALIESRSMMVIDQPAISDFLSVCVLLDETGRTIAAGRLLPDATDDMAPMRLDRKSSHISPYQSPITTEKFEQLLGQKGLICWMSGLSGSGKSTLAREIQKLLFSRGRHAVILDGDNLRSGLCRDLGFSTEDRHENIRRAAETARLFAEHGVIVLTAFITPTAKDRQLASDICGRYIQHIHINADIGLCEQRDVKGLYQKARRGEIADFTGISAPFDVPEIADLVIDTSLPLSESVTQLADFIETKIRP